MPTLHVELFAGRPPAVKAELARALTDACVAVLGSPADAVQVVFHDVARHDWATGGVLWSARAPAPPEPGAAA
ncbi:MAG: 4-oxalocrotonate tautomerase [Pseudomonadota bacterium]|nr:tautomerase family protein [Rubrivivax sp.]